MRHLRVGNTETGGSGRKKKRGKDKIFVRWKECHPDDKPTRECGGRRDADV